MKVSVNENIVTENRKQKMTIPTVYLICGFLGAGKTTYAKKLAQSTGAIHLNPDEICMKRYKREEYENNWEYCFSQTVDYLWEQTAAYVRQNKDVILDMGFWSKSSRKEARKKVIKMGANVKGYYIYAPDVFLKQRIMSRKGKIAEQNFLNFDIIKKSFEEPSEDENFIMINNF